MSLLKHLKFTLVMLFSIIKICWMAVTRQCVPPAQGHREKLKVSILFWRKPTFLRSTCRDSFEFQLIIYH